jgi:pimeloyl-ACP methyl ester carboxylesterase
MTRTRRAFDRIRGEPRLRRAYFDCRYGQLHMHYAIPSGGGFDEAVPLLCLHGQPGSGRFFRPLLTPLGRDRSVYAPDLPGSGESDPPPAEAGNPELASALTDFLDSMHLRRVDLLAHGNGAAIALTLLQLRPELVGRIVLSPANEALQTQARQLHHSVLVVDLAPNEPNAAPAEIERQAAALREFLGLH